LPIEQQSEIQAGSLVETDKGYFFIAISLGIVEVNKEKVIVISPAAPLGQALLGLSVGDSLTFNNQDYSIKSVS
jgi:transcription elongation GreA/GreB family factor